jgi:hypothetical protein
MRESKLFITVASRKQGLTKNSVPDAILEKNLYIANLAATFRTRLFRAEIEDLTKAVRSICTLFSELLTEQQVEFLIREMHLKNYEIKYQNKMWDSILTKVKPENLILEDASYGNFASLVLKAKDLSIRIIEPQHGWIGPGHFAYNYGSGASKSFWKFKPDYLLIFGNFWMTDLSFPVKFISIGKQHLNELNLKSISNHKKPNVITFFSSGYEVLRMYKEARIAARMLIDQNFQVRFRLHPVELEYFNSVVKLDKQIDNFALDFNNDPYASILESQYIVGYSSTVLYEALALKSKPIAIKTPITEIYIDSEYIELVESVEELVEIVRRGTEDSEMFENFDLNIENIWASDSEFKIREFFELIEIN